MPLWLRTSGRAKALDIRRFLTTTLLGLFITNLWAEPLAPPPLPNELAWVFTTNNPVKAVIERPVECVNIPVEPMRRAQFILGRLAFESPALLGGQAARMGLSCASCHPSARTNKHFFIKNISGAAGTADVSENFFSSQGGNDYFAPVAIPDLADRANMQFLDRDTPKFREKLLRLVTVEFDGQPPSTTTLDALQIYLQQVDQKHCDDKNKTIAKTWQQDWSRLFDAVELIERAIEDENNKQLLFVVRMARLRLQVLFDRYGIANSAQLNAALIQSSRELQKLTKPVNPKNPAGSSIKLLKWKAKNAVIMEMLDDKQQQSAYNAVALSKYLNSH